MHKKSASGWRKHLDFIIIDIVCLHVAFFLAHLIRHRQWNLYVDNDYAVMAIALVVADVLVAVLFTSFKGVLRRGYYAEFVAAFKHVMLVEFMTIGWVYTMKKGVEYSRAILFMMPVIHLFLTVLARYGWKRYLRKRKFNQGIRPLLLVTVKSLAESAVKDITADRYKDYRLQGVIILDGNYVGQTIGGVPIVASGEDVLTYVQKQWVDGVMLLIPANMRYPTRLVENFQRMGIAVHRVIAKRNEDTDVKVQVERIANYTVLTSSMNYMTSEALVIKRIQDILGGIVGCILTGFVMLIFGPIIYAKSPGPIIFTQVRVGENGKPFKIYKLRTMYLDAEERKQELMEQNKVKDGMMFKMDFDPRIIGNRVEEDGTVKTGIGSFLRKYSLDEFPQFFNILKGDMSLVGTRPPTMDEWNRYALHHRARMAIKPGLTGLWQVSGRSNITDFEEVVKLDTKYISEWSFGLDLKILVKTIVVVFGKKGAV